jgi:CheY-like chemotaxis protein
MASCPFNILVVDDEPPYLAIITKFLHQGGYATTQASNGTEALNLLGKSLPNLIITDLRMPDLDGISLAEHVRVRWPDIPILLMSGYLSETKRLLKGFAGFIQKPFDRATLMDIIQPLVARHFEPHGQTALKLK